MYRILICDDQKDIVNALKIYLTPEGYDLYEAYNGQEAVELCRKTPMDLILLDVMMPVMDGVTATAKIREFSNAPIILLTAKSETEDKVLGLNVGADDYITKPFVPVEVLARIRSQLRRYSRMDSRTEDKETLTIGGISLDDRTKSVTVEGEPVSLTPRSIPYCICSCPTPARSIPPRPSMRPSGRRPLWAARAVLPCISAICGKKSRSTPLSPGT